MTEYSFIITSPIEVYETLGPSKMRLTGTFIRLNMPTENGRIYQVQESEQIMKDLTGKAVYIHGNKKGEHILNDSNLIGKVINVFLKNDIIKGVVEVWNNSNFPNIISKIKEGWGFSIGGTVQKFIKTGRLNHKLRPIVHAIGLRANQLQLLEPTEKRGDKQAMVEGVIPIMETFQVSEGELEGEEETIDIEDIKKMKDDIEEIKKILIPPVVEDKPKNKKKLITEEHVILYG